MVSRIECRNCHLIFNDVRVLNSHVITYGVGTQTQSFSAVWRGTTGGASKDSTAAHRIGQPIDKVLPLSQPLTQTTEIQTTVPSSILPPNPQKCSICGKSCPTARGLKAHITACEKKQKL